MGKKWIADAIKKKGALHKDLGVKQGKKIPEKKLKKLSIPRIKLLQNVLIWPKLSNLFIEVDNG